MIKATEARQIYLQNKDIEHDDNSRISEINELIAITMKYGGFRITIEKDKLSAVVIDQLKKNGYQVLFASDRNLRHVSWKSCFIPYNQLENLL